MERKKVAVITIVYKSTLKEHEKISLDFSTKNLSKYDRIIVSPKSLKKIDLYFELMKFKIERFPDKFFKSTKEYNKLATSSLFYKRFKEYKYVLFCELDTLVFKDELEYFCSLDYDFIGAPFVDNKLKKIKNLEKIKNRNGGFSLRKVDSFIKITEEYEKKNFKNSWFLKYYLTHFLGYNIGKFKGILRGKTNRNNLFTINEDLFWSVGAKKINPKFKIAPFEIALSFSFENNIPLCFKMNHNKIPFGAHAFQCKRNLKEWEELGVFNKKDKSNIFF